MHHLSGKTFGRLSVRDRDNKKWNCECICGNMKRVMTQHLLSGVTTSCGCYHKEIVSGKCPIKEANPVIYRAWQSMKTRCYNQNTPYYPRWGGRGIRVCDEWLNDFYAFLDYVGPKPSPDYSLDRIDNNGHYEPGNVRWASPQQQNDNRGIRGRALRVERNG
jgi:hypothetical protein